MNKKDIHEIKKGELGTGLLIENDGYVSINSTEHNKLIKEEFDNSSEWHVPSPFVLDVVMQKFDIKNANGRIYPERILKREIEKYQQKIAEHRAYGECNHPSDSTIDLGRISHNIIECHWEGHTLVGKLEFNLSEGFKRFGICSTLGDTCALLILNGMKIGVSSRGIGSVEQKLGNTIVGEDFELICFDIVSDPSTPGAFIGNKENLQQYVENDLSNSKKNKLQEKLDKISKILLS